MRAAGLQLRTTQIAGCTAVLLVSLARAQRSRLGEVRAAGIDDSADPRLPLLPWLPHCVQLRTGE